MDEEDEYQKIKDYYAEKIERAQQIVEAGVSYPEQASPLLVAAVFEKIAMPLYYLHQRWRAEDARKKQGEKHA